jgi:ATP-binding cassette subfamily C protein
LLLFIVLIAVDFFLPLRALGSAFHVSMNGATAGRKILALLDTPETEWGTATLDAFDISMKDVTFGYTADRNILEHVSLEAHPGEFVAIVGLSGSGKSTVISLLSGVRMIEEGSICIGGTNLQSLSREDYYRHMGVISYNTYLFQDTVRNNFKMAKPDISDQEIQQRLADVGLSDVVTADLILQEGTVNLSGGQRQRLALAVNLASDKEIYFFDEVTSNIDVDSENIILENIRKLSKNKTVIMVSHRLKNFVNADRIYVLDRKKVAEIGTHEELMRHLGLYHKMFSEQQKMEEGYLQ